METSETQTQNDNSKSNSDWIKAPVANLVRYKPSGVYYARARIKGKLYFLSLKTTVMSVAKLKLADFMKERQQAAPDGVIMGKLTMDGAIQIFLSRLEGQQDIKSSSKEYRKYCLKALVKSWPDLKQKPASRITTEDCRQWAGRFSDYCASAYNNTVDTLRMLFDIAIEKGARANNPATVITKKTAKPKELHLPSPEQFEQFLCAMENAGGWCSHDCADLVRFLAYGGFRKTEAASILWGDCDFANATIRIRVTKNGKPRSVPMIPEMKALLERIKSKTPEAQAGDPVMLVSECEEAMTRAAGKIGMDRITHHDLRHLFATRCIESGVDIPTVSRWLGHQDGGALAMKVYGHLRDHHSASMAAKVSFSSQPANNVIALPQQQEAGAL